ncbi:hypothetical protein GGH93_000141 [Coemansia aciculifera]|nr:hypothetical protein GGH93_000141 [Coemansia aciculifera]
MAPEQRVSKVFKLLENVGKEEHISGKMTQLDHALQAAHFVKKEGADEETILAALMLNIGRISITIDKYDDFVIGDRVEIYWNGCAGNTSDTLDNKQTVQYPTGQVPDFIAVDRYEADDFTVRKFGFTKKTSELIESNVLARRYLLTTGYTFQVGPNDGNVIEIEMKRGPLSPTEIQEFEKDPLFKQKVQLAKWDDAAAKVTEVKPPTLDTYRDMAIKNLLMSMYAILVASLTFARNSVAKMAEVGYAPQTLVAAQQYMVFRPTFAHGDGMHGHGHVYERAGEPASNEEGNEEGNGGQGNGGKDESDEGGNGGGRGGDDPESDEFRDLLISSSEFEDNSASTCGGSLVLTALLAAGSVWAAVF